MGHGGSGKTTFGRNVGMYGEDEKSLETFMELCGKIQSNPLEREALCQEFLEKESLSAYMRNAVEELRDQMVEDM